MTDSIECLETTWKTEIKIKLSNKIINIMCSTYILVKLMYTPLYIIVCLTDTLLALILEFITSFALGIRLILFSTDSKLHRLVRIVPSNLGSLQQKSLPRRQMPDRRRAALRPSDFSSRRS